ncbi:hypothetical protein J31TS4_21770 [Paenibacillus sp. J31TS4]|uniref:GyrI-like domain-containing protein n=1 Tax=Paenibacillus sp. J31TS4 TaxID=2807195 RepID=UPI001B236282|nr:GyrI-like domain-containing protein [Paenibacillus sp. J31TS4]GIP38897.1 hypothetical protein J31TS4_21770 [Paenibacillus sp. J31TS4]
MQQKEKQVELVQVPALRALAVRTPTTPDKSGTRTAWRMLMEQIPANDPRWVETGTAYVFIPQAGWSGTVKELWVGRAVTGFGEVPEGVEALELPAGLCAKVDVHGDEAQMNEAYAAMFRWLDESPEYELDISPGTLGREENRLSPLNPFTVPYEQVGTFSFAMLYPVRPRQRR